MGSSILVHMALVDYDHAVQVLKRIRQVTVYGFGIQQGHSSML